MPDVPEIDCDRPMGLTCRQPSGVTALVNPSACGRGGDWLMPLPHGVAACRWIAFSFPPYIGLSSSHFYSGMPVAGTPVAAAAVAAPLLVGPRRTITRSGDRWPVRWRQPSRRTVAVAPLRTLSTMSSPSHPPLDEPTRWPCGGGSRMRGSTAKHCPRLQSHFFP